MIILLTLNFVSAASAYLILRYLVTVESFLDYIIYFFLLFCSQIILTQQLLGLAGILTLGNVFILNLLIFLGLFFCFKVFKLKTGTHVLPIFNKFKTALNLTKLEYFCLAIFLGFAIVKLSINLFNPPFGWDNLNYHFTFPVEWMKHGNLDNPIVVSDDPAPSYYPINAGLIFLWFIFPLKNVFLADLVSFPFLLLSGILVYKITREFGLGRKLSFFSMFLFMLTPNVFKQIEVAYIDIIVCAFYLGGLYFILRLKENFKFTYFLFAALSLGLLIGTKTLALVYSLTLLFPLIFLCIFYGRKRRWLYLAALIFVLVILGGFSYIRNLIITGNPMYPVDIVVFGKTIFKGVIDRASYSAHFVPDDYRIDKILYHEGLGAQGTLFVLPGIFLFFPLIIRRRLIKLNLLNIYFSVLPLIIFLIWRFVIPLGNVRYLSPLLGLSMVYGFVVFNRILPAKVLSILVFLCVLGSVSEFADKAELIISLALAGFMFFALIKGYFRIKYAKILVIVFIVFLGFSNINYEKFEFSRYKRTPFWRDAYLSWQWLSGNTDRANISYVGRPVPFPLYGSKLKNNVFYTSVNEVEPAKLHFFKGSRYSWKYDYIDCHRNYEEEYNYRGKAEYGIWLSNLRSRKAEFLYVYSLHQIKGIEFPFEDRWAKEHPDLFEPVFTNETIHIYRIK